MRSCATFRDTPQSRAAAASLALVVSVSLVLAQLATLVHDLSVDHAICPEHGEFIDVVRVPLEAEAPLAFRAAEEAAGHHHEHCNAAALLRAARQASRPAQPVAAPVSWRESCCFPADWVPAAIPLLSLAPKSSPPDAGRA